MQRVLDELQQPPSLSDDDGRGPLALDFGSRAPQRERFAEEKDLRERRSQLVRHAGSELGADARELLLLSQSAQMQQRDREQEHQQADEDLESGEIVRRHEQTSSGLGTKADVNGESRVEAREIGAVARSVGRPGSARPQRLSPGIVNLDPEHGVERNVR